MTGLLKPTLEEFLTQPDIDESPAWEFIDSMPMQKPMPKVRHAIIQKKLLAAIDAHTEIFTALPELRCTFGDRSLVPDIAVIAWSRLTTEPSGEWSDNFYSAPDWAIEILSPEQNANRVIDNLLYCLRYECQLGWLIDPNDSSVLILLKDSAPLLCRGEQSLPVLEGVELSLTPSQIFGWLKP